MPLTTSAMNGGRSFGPLLRRTSLVVVFSLSALMAGCTMPKHMRVENAYHPKHEDTDVLFRATYYFRVFDYCADQVKSTQQPQSDTLYRFRMTGKASSLFNDVHFESGTLTASQIDPLGSNVVYDERNRQFYFKSQGEAQQEGLRERKYADLERLVAVYGRLSGEEKAADTNKIKPASPPASAASDAKGSAAGAGDGPTSPSGNKRLDEPLLADFRSVIQQRILSLKDPELQPKANGSGDTGSTGSTGSNVVPPVAAPAASGAASAPGQECLQFKRGFQILGPEGWRTFNQNERLLLAMSSSSKPLISTMQELSGRVLNNQPIEAELLLPLVQEDLRISLAERELEKFTGTNPERGDELLINAINKLSRGGQK